MAQIILDIRDDALKAEIEDAFEASYANPDGLTKEELTKRHLENLALSVLNEYREKVAVEAAKDAVVKETSLS
jgi:hypothetical protein